MKQKEILLFGASGQIGRNLIRKLTKNNYKIIAVTRNIHRAGYILKTQANPGYLELVELSNFNLNRIEDLIKNCDICILKHYIQIFQPCYQGLQINLK